MKVAIIGAGAIGGYVGAKLALAGEDLTLIVRGANLAAIREHGLRLIMADGIEHRAANVRATDNYDEAGPQDLVILAMKALSVRRQYGWIRAEAVRSRDSRGHDAERNSLLVLLQAWRRGT